MALICEFGTAPDQKAEGYGRMLGVVGEPAEFGKNRTLRFSGHS